MGVVTLNKLLAPCYTQKLICLVSDPRLKEADCNCPLAHSLSYCKCEKKKRKAEDNDDEEESVEKKKLLKNERMSEIWKCAKKSRQKK